MTMARWGVAESAFDDEVNAVPSVDAAALAKLGRVLTPITSATAPRT